MKKQTKNLELNELQENQPKLNFANHKSDKYDFYSSIDENTNLDINSKYYDTQDFNEMIKTLSPEKKFSLLHTNMSSLTGNGEKLEYTLENLNLKFDIIAVTETWECATNKHMFTPITLIDYKGYEGQPGSTRKEGCGLYIRDDLDYIPRTDLDTKFKNGKAEFEMKWIELIEGKKCNKIIGVIYRHPNNKDIDFNLALSKILQNVSKENKQIIIAGDFNYDLLSYNKHERINDFIETMYGNLCQPCIMQLTRVVEKQNPSLIDNIFINTIEHPVVSGNLIDRISDHFPNFIIIENTIQKERKDIDIYKRNTKNYNQIVF